MTESAENQVDVEVEVDESKVWKVLSNTHFNVDDVSNLDNSVDKVNTDIQQTESFDGSEPPVVPLLTGNK